MAKIRLGRREAEEYDLPHVCAVCGAKGVCRRSKTFSWHPPWVGLLIFFGLLAYAIVALILIKRMTVCLPFCTRHRNYWRNRSAIVYGGLFALLLAGGGSVMALNLLDEPGPVDSFGLYGVGGGGLFLIWLISIAIVQLVSIRALEITERSITLRGVAEELVEAIYDDRDLAEEEHERLWKKRYDRGRDDEPVDQRQTSKDDGGYYDPKRAGRSDSHRDDEGYFEKKKEPRRRSYDDEDV